MKELNSVELKKELLNIASESKKYSIAIYNGIIDAIMNYYFNNSNYYSDNAINSLNGFINNGILNF